MTRTNEEWLHDLHASGSLQASAIAELRDLLLRAALYCFSRNLSDFEGLSRDEILQRAEDCAQNALIAVLDHLSDFRGDSKFTTWAYKFSINIALTTARHERWNGVSLNKLDSSTDGSFLERMMEDKTGNIAPEESAMRADVLRIMQDVIAHDLTDRQRRVLLMMVFHEVPMDEVVRYFGTNRNAIYKLLHDARRKLKSRLEAHGIEIGETLALFGRSR